MPTIRRRWRKANARPTKPSNIIAHVAGSGTAACNVIELPGPVSNNAPLFAVAMKLFAESDRNATRYIPCAPSFKLNVGVKGPLGPFKFCVPMLACRTKNPVMALLPSNACVAGRYAPIGLFGLALIPRYDASVFDVQGVDDTNEKLVTPPGTVEPLIVTSEAFAAVTARLSGTRTSTNIVPDALLPGETVHPKFTGGLLVIGVLVPLSTQPAAQKPCNGSSISVSAKAGTVAKANSPAATTAKFLVIEPPELGWKVSR